MADKNPNELAQFNVIISLIEIYTKQGWEQTERNQSLPEGVKETFAEKSKYGGWT